MKTIESRIAHLEKQNRRLRICGFVAMMLIATAVMMAADDRTAVTVVNHKNLLIRRKLIVGDIGKAQVVITGTEILFKDANGTSRLMMGMVSDGPVLMLVDKDGGVRAKLYAIDGKTPGDATTEFTLFAPKNKERITLISAAKTSGLIVRGTSGKPRVVLGTNGDVAVSKTN